MAGDVVRRRSILEASRFATRTTDPESVGFVDRRKLAPGMLAALTVAAARQAEAAFGPGPALGVIAAALDGTDDEGRRALLIAGLGLAVRGGERAAFERFAARWETCGGGAGERRGLSLVARLDAAGHATEALRFARAEVTRHRSADALFALGALEADAGRVDAARAALDAAAALEARPTRYAAAALAHGPSERADEAEAALAAASDSATAIRLATTALGSPKLYARVRVLDRLAELAVVASTREAALRVAVAHADRRGASLTPIERDRLALVGLRAGASVDVVRALATGAPPTVSDHEAREALLGRTPAERGDRATTVALRALAAVVAESGSAPLLLSALAVHPPSPPAWTAAITGLRAPSTRAAAATCVDRWLSSGIAPPRGFGPLGSVLVRAELPALAQRAFAEGVAAADRGAREAFAAWLAERGQAAYQAGDRAEARRLLERSLALVPDPV